MVKKRRETMCLPAPPSDLTFDTDANTFQGPWFCRDASWLGSATTMGRAFVIRGSVLADGWHFRDSLHYEAVKTKLVSDLSGVHGVLVSHRQSFAHVCSLSLQLTGKSCLLAKTRRRASRSSSSFSMRWSSSRASTTRSRSLLSTTKMIPWVFWK